MRGCIEWLQAARTEGPGFLGIALSPGCLSLPFTFMAPCSPDAPYWARNCNCRQSPNGIAPICPRTDNECNTSRTRNAPLSPEDGCQCPCQDLVAHTTRRRKPTRAPPQGPVKACAPATGSGSARHHCLGHQQPDRPSAPIRQASHSRTRSYVSHPRHEHDQPEHDVAHEQAAAQGLAERHGDGGGGGHVAVGLRAQGQREGEVSETAARWASTWCALHIAQCEGGTSPPPARPRLVAVVDGDTPAGGPGIPPHAACKPA